ncbi:hypothetical protein DSM3645_19803 [Blastopirellula marina DSM 3645]|uniref:Uncharacterized protein n=1 Tax=Blastopirellula marina DSM 3645 TaxID=314230 RepID=A3ZTL0_9BACT|nr:hypothetical protein DSM3645_19803 [Blastopirellula marina DSM 3645]
MVESPRVQGKSHRRKLFQRSILNSPRNRHASLLIPAGSQASAVFIKKAAMRKTQGGLVASRHTDARNFKLFVD